MTGGETTHWQLLRKRIEMVVWFAFASLYLFALPVTATLPLWVPAGLLLTAAVAAAGYALIRRWFSRRSPHFSAGRSFAFSFAGILAVLSALVALPFYVAAYLALVAPAAMPLAKLSNGTKTVMFQGMQHVGSEQFYKSVVFDLQQALSDGYTLFFEGVQPSPDVPGADDWVATVLAGGESDLPQFYARLASACGIGVQSDYFKVMKTAVQSNDPRYVMADVTMAAMKAEYDRLVAADPSYAGAVADEAASDGETDDSFDLLGLFAKARETGTRRQAWLAEIACFGFFNLAISIVDYDPAPLDKIILDFRNRHLADLIRQSPADKIYITYGAGHLPGLIEDLQGLDPAWKVESVGWVRSMPVPGEPDGSLPDGLQTQ